MKKKYTRRQIMESIKYWQKQLRAGNYKKLNETYDPGEYEIYDPNSDNIELELDCTMEKPYKNGRYNGEYTPAEFKAFCKDLERRYKVKINVTIPGASASEATIYVSGPEANVRKCYQKLSAGKIISNTEWEEAKDSYIV